VNTTKFIPGLQMAEGFFKDEVEPRLSASFPKLRYSAALIDGGSEVLGFDIEMSADHHWGPRVMIFLQPADYKTGWRKLKSSFRKNLPPSYRN
jgi:hypothetical protein